jgi:hypothetical protein
VTRMDNGNLDQGNLDHLFEQYRTAVPAPEASANFMPDLWRKIEARKFFLFRVKRLAQVFVAAAAAICLFLGIVLQAPFARSKREMPGNYIDLLTEANPGENLAAMGIRIDYVEPSGK